MADKIIIIDLSRNQTSNRIKNSLGKHIRSLNPGKRRGELYREPIRHPASVKEPRPVKARCGRHARLTQRAPDPPPLQTVNTTDRNKVNTATFSAGAVSVLSMNAACWMFK